jgi:oxygen-independent coproporphyrinogen III oxidase
VTNSPFSLYIHFPFCRKKCPYCDFATDAVARIPQETYLEAVLMELDYWAYQPHWRSRPLHSIFFGGGTPSLLHSKSIDRIINVACRSFPPLRSIEITLEANPGALSEESLQGFSNAGINRLSLGAQSFSPRILKRLGRDHEAHDTPTAVSLAKKVGICNLSIDLLYGCPDQSIDDFHYDLTTALSLAPKHLSLYSLTLEKGTPFFQAFERGDLALPNEDLHLEMIELSDILLKEAGYHRYEISSYALAHFESQHNSSYWRGTEYLGIGPGAHSFCRAPTGNEGTRWANKVSLAEYWTDVALNGKSIAWQEFLSPQKMMSEFFLLGLRRIEGVSLSTFEQLFHQSPHTVFGDTFNELISLALITINGDRVQLTPKGLLFSDTVGQKFM